MTWLVFTFVGFSQPSVFTKQDTIRGSITPQRAWWNLRFYDLHVDVQPKDSSISGFNTIYYEVMKKSEVLQIDLQQPMKITKVIQDDKPLKFTSEGSAHFIRLKKEQKPGKVNKLIIYFEGKPTVSTNPPWSGGFSWQKDEHGKDFIATTCQGIGASLWWPCKDHPADEPDDMNIHVSIPADLGLTAVSNGRLHQVSTQNGKTTFVWKVVNPINNYAVNINIGDYVNFTEQYQGEKGTLDCSYYVLRDHLPQAKGQFRQVPLMLEAFEHWFGPYPFYEDSYKLVEVPYLGMEHQSSVTYGNGFRNGYKQKDLSGTGWGFSFDFIIVHESGHEWFANSITNQDVADMWIHEGFTSYSESLFLEYHYGQQAGAEYVTGKRKNVKNDQPVIGKYDVNYDGSTDMYYKGENMLHTLRQLVNDDKKWRNMLRKMNVEFYHQTVTSRQIERFLSTETGINLQTFFDQYLRETQLPVFEYQVENGILKYRWKDCVKGFDMPLQVNIDGKELRLKPSADWQVYPTDQMVTKVIVDRDFYVTVTQL